MKEGEPAVAAVGAMVAIAGAATMRNGCGSERPAPAESIACTITVPGVRNKAAEIAAVNAVELTKVVARPAPLNVSTLPRVNPAPPTVMLTAGPLLDATAGVTVNSTGDTVNGTALELAAPALVTVTGKLPESARSSGVMSARSWVALT